MHLPCRNEMTPESHRATPLSQRDDTKVSTCDSLVAPCCFHRSTPDPRSLDVMPEGSAGERRPSTRMNPSVHRRRDPFPTSVARSRCTIGRSSRDDRAAPRLTSASCRSRTHVPRTKLTLKVENRKEGARSRRGRNRATAPPAPAERPRSRPAPTSAHVPVTRCSAKAPPHPFRPRSSPLPNPI